MSRPLESLVTAEPRTVTEIYREWAGLGEWKALTRRLRNERREVAVQLESLANQEIICRGVVEQGGRSWVAFWALGTNPPHTSGPRPVSGRPV